MDETDQLARAFGLSPFEEMPSSTDLQAISVFDRTDYSELVGKSASPPPKHSAPSSGEQPSQKPWWKFW
jgi:hypothetical protein